MTDFHVDHLQNTRNAGKPKKFNRVIESKSDYCGDMIKFFLQIEDGTIKDIGFEVFGCWAIITACSIMSEYMRDKKIEELKALTEEDLEEICKTKEVPEIKRHCFLLPLKVIKEL